MKIRNVSAKIIGVAGTPIIPDHEMVVNKKMVSVPSVQRLIDDGMLVLVGEWEAENQGKKEKKAGAETEVQVEKNVDETGEEKKVEETEPVEKTTATKGTRGPRAKK